MKTGQLVSTNTCDVKHEAVKNGNQYVPKNHFLPTWIKMEKIKVV